MGKGGAERGWGSGNGRGKKGGRKLASWLFWGMDAPVPVSAANIWNSLPAPWTPRFSTVAHDFPAAT